MEPETPKKKNSFRNLRPVKDSRGAIIDFEFRPSALMWRIALECIREENVLLPIKEILSKCDVPYSTWVRWTVEYCHVDEATLEERNFFEDWWNGFMDTARMDVRSALIAVGKHMAINEKDFRYWKEMSHITGVINPENRQHAIPVNLGKQDVSIEEIKHAKAKLLSAHRGMGNTGGVGLAESAPVRRKISTP